MMALERQSSSWVLCDKLGWPWPPTQWILTVESALTRPLPRLRGAVESFSNLSRPAQPNLIASTHPHPAPAFLLELLGMKPQCLGASSLPSKNNVPSYFAFPPHFKNKYVVFQGDHSKKNKNHLMTWSAHLKQEKSLSLYSCKFLSFHNSILEMEGVENFQDS